MEDKDFDYKKYQDLWHKEQTQMQTQHMFSREEIHQIINRENHLQHPSVWMQMLVAIVLLLLGLIGMICMWRQGTLSWMLTIVLLTVFSMVLVIMLMNHPRYWQRIVCSTFSLLLLIGIAVWILPMPHRDSSLIEKQIIVYNSVGRCDGIDRAICNMEECDAERYVNIAYTILNLDGNNVQNKDIAL